MPRAASKQAHPPVRCEQDGHPLRPGVLVHPTIPDRLCIEQTCEKCRSRQMTRRAKRTCAGWPALAGAPGLPRRRRRPPAAPPRCPACTAWVRAGGERWRAREGQVSRTGGGHDETRTQRGRSLGSAPPAPDISTPLHSDLALSLATRALMSAICLGTNAEGDSRETERAGGYCGGNKGCRDFRR